MFLKNLTCYLYFKFRFVLIIVAIGKISVLGFSYSDVCVQCKNIHTVHVIQNCALNEDGPSIMPVIFSYFMFSISKLGFILF